MHDTAVAQLTNEHNQTLAEIRSCHQQELDQIQRNRDEIKTEQTRLVESTYRSFLIGQNAQRHPAMDSEGIFNTSITVEIYNSRISWNSCF